MEKNLGFSKKRSFLNIILPSARPAIVAGLSFVAMETLSDFGAVSFFGISTLTTAIYNAWISFDDLALARPSILLPANIKLTIIYFRKFF